MIPKKIHYCWFGGNEKPKTVEKCIASWRKYCPDYEIIEWNEENFDVQQNPYIKYCYDNKKWAFLSDLARLLVVCEHGGIYFDTDVELVRKPDFLLEYGAFYGFETPEYVATGLGFGAQAHHPTIESMIDEYSKLEADESGKFPTITCPNLNTQALLPFGLKKNGEKQLLLENALILPIEYMNPYDDPKGILNKTENTVSVHWYSKSWMSKKTILRSKLMKPFHRAFGNDCFRWLKK